MDRLFTLCYLPPCLAWLAVMIRWPRLASNHDRITGGFVGFAVLLLAVPLVSERARENVKTCLSARECECADRV